MITDLRKRPAAPSPKAGVSAALALGFRPFFLLAGLFSTLVVPLWLLVFTGWLTLPSRLAPSAWHAHEMVFGFAGAVLAGFLLTAVRNWTSQETLSGVALGALVSLWLFGRVAISLDGPIPHAAVAGIDLAFLPALAGAIALPIVRAKNWRNLGFVPLLLGLTLANALFHFGPPGWTARATLLAVDVVLLVIILMGGRVIPSFTSNALGAPIERSPLLDWGSLVAMGFTAALGVVPASGHIAGVAAIVAGAFNGARLARWRPLATRGKPILWVLHLGYGWIALGLVLRGVAAFVPDWMPSAPTHALTVGAIGLLILGMTSRVSLGHTGRMLAVSPPVAGAFGLLAAAAAVRSFGPLLLPSRYLAEVVLSGALWSAAFGVFTVAFAPILTAPRVDGKPG